MKNELEPTGICWCGCGKETKSGAFFCRNHDRIAEAAVTFVEYGSIASFLKEHDYGPGKKNPIKAREALERSRKDA